jgi:protein-L-isoaspartate(D-aspartate) O-methyltransferase
VLQIQSISKDWTHLIENLVKSGALRSPKVIQAMKQVPRSNFLPIRSIEYASMDTPLPIGEGQTISAPHMVAIMNEALKLRVGNNVLEVGAGCGWHAATIAKIIAPEEIPRSEHGHIFTIEIVPELAQMARENIMRLGFGDKVTVVNGDGSMGLSEKGPFDRILVTAAAPEIPPPLVKQLKSEGILVIPVGSIHLFQTLIRIQKKIDGSLTEEKLGGVAFVPLTGNFGHKI